MKNNIANIIEKSRKIIVFTGAGISTNSGIPDFRGTEGLYKMVKDTYNLPYGEAIFDIKYFAKDPLPFYDFSRNVLSQSSRPTTCHHLLARLEKEGKITQIITQNIDRLHQKAGSKKILECHGTYERGHCIACKKEYSLQEYSEPLMNGDIPLCSCGGYIKPDIVFFGESLPQDFYTFYEKPPEADLLLILGTSLNVQPAAGLALKIGRTTESIIVNKDPTDYDHLIDHIIHKDLDDFAKAF